MPALRTSGVAERLRRTAGGPGEGVLPWACRRLLSSSHPPGAASLHSVAGARLCILMPEETRT